MRQWIKRFVRAAASGLGFVLAVLVLLAELTLPMVLVVGA